MDKALFKWRDEGKKFDIGDEQDGGISSLITIGDILVCITRKNIYSILLADSVDPKRNNPSIPDSQQKVLSYGSDHAFVGRTLLQAKVLFEDHCLPNNIDNKKALVITFSFLHEICSLYEILTAYLKEENSIKETFNGKVGGDQSLRVPSINNLEQRVKQFIINSDHATRCIMEITQLFYPDIKKDKWSVQLHEKIKAIKEDGDSAGKFFKAMSIYMWQIRNLRNAVEHPTSEDKVEISNYKLTESGKIRTPTILYNHPKTTLSEMSVSAFIEDSVENLITTFESMIAYLCDIHAQPFAHNPRRVVEIPKDKREPHEKNINFGYYINWSDSNLKS